MSNLSYRRAITPPRLTGPGGSIMREVYRNHSDELSRLYEAEVELAYQRKELFHDDLLRRRHDAKTRAMDDEEKLREHQKRLAKIRGASPRRSNSSLTGSGGVGRRGSGDVSASFSSPTSPFGATAVSRERARTPTGPANIDTSPARTRNHNETINDKGTNDSVVGGGRTPRSEAHERPASRPQPRPRSGPSRGDDDDGADSFGCSARLTRPSAAVTAADKAQRTADLHRALREWSRASAIRVDDAIHHHGAVMGDAEVPIYLPSSMTPERGRSPNPEEEGEGDGGRYGDGGPRAGSNDALEAYTNDAYQYYAEQVQGPREAAQLHAQQQQQQQRRRRQEEGMTSEEQRHDADQAEEGHHQYDYDDYDRRVRAEEEYAQLGRHFSSPRRHGYQGLADEEGHGDGDGVRAQYMYPTPRREQPQHSSALSASGVQRGQRHADPYQYAGGDAEVGGGHHSSDSAEGGVHSSAHRSRRRVMDVDETLTANYLWSDGIGEREREGIGSSARARSQRRHVTPTREGGGGVAMTTTPTRGPRGASPAAVVTTSSAYGSGVATLLPAANSNHSSEMRAAGRRSLIDRGDDALTPQRGGRGGVRRGGASPSTMSGTPTPRAAPAPSPRGGVHMMGVGAGGSIPVAALDGLIVSLERSIRAAIRQHFAQCDDACGELVRLYQAQLGGAGGDGDGGGGGLLGGGGHARAPSPSSLRGGASSSTSVVSDEVIRLARHWSLGAGSPSDGITVTGLRLHDPQQNADWALTVEQLIAYATKARLQQRVDVPPTALNLAIVETIRSRAEALSQQAIRKVIPLCFQLVALLGVVG